MQYEEAQPPPYKKTRSRKRRLQYLLPVRSNAIAAIQASIIAKKDLRINHLHRQGSNVTNMGTNMGYYKEKLEEYSEDVDMGTDVINIRGLRGLWLARIIAFTLYLKSKLIVSTISLCASTTAQQDGLSGFTGFSILLANKTSLHA